MARVLFVCLHNAGRSQMSLALFERAAEGSHEAESAGTTPGVRVHPAVVEAMRELGIDLSEPRAAEADPDDGRTSGRRRDDGLWRRVPVQYRASGTSTGTFPTRRTCRSRRCAPYATRSPTARPSWSRRWTAPTRSAHARGGEVLAGLARAALATQPARLAAADPRPGGPPALQTRLERVPFGARRRCPHRFGPRRGGVGLRGSRRLAQRPAGVGPSAGARPAP